MSPCLYSLLVPNFKDSLHTKYRFGHFKQLLNFTYARDPEQRLLKSLRPSVPMTQLRVFNGFLSNFILGVPLKLVDTFEFLFI
jgi:hypothetical protein